MNAKRYRSLSLSFFLLILISAQAAPPAAGSGSNIFKAFNATLPGRVQDTMVEDIDQDGLKDIFITWVEGTSPNYTRGFTVFFNNKDGFSEQSRQNVKVPNTVALIDIGNIDTEKGLEVVGLCKGSVSYYPLRARQFGKLTKLCGARPFTAMADDNSIPYYNFVYDWNADGKDELLLQEIDRTMLYQTGANGIDAAKPQELSIDAGISIHMGGPERLFDEHQSLRAFYYMPQINSVDYDGDGLVDLVASNRSRIEVFKQYPDGSFSRQPDVTLQLKLPKPTQKEGKKNRGEENHPNLLIDDFNRDGKMDMIASQINGNISDLRSQTFIFYGHTGSLQRNKPDQIIERNQAASFALVRDIDGDKTLDLIVPYINIDLLSLAQMIITTSANVNFAMYTIPKGKTFPTQPTGTDATSIKFNMRDMVVEGGVPNVDGDFNGDGKNDAVVGKNMTELHVRLGHGKGNFDQKPWSVINVRAPLFPDVDDLNRDGLADIIVTYLPYDDNDHKLFVFMNKSKPPAHPPAAPAPAAPRPAVAPPRPAAPAAPAAPKPASPAPKPVPKPTPKG